jgi:hypothetical protein
VASLAGLLSEFSPIPSPTSLFEKRVPLTEGFFQPAHISATNIELLLPEAVLIQFVSPDDEHDVLETCREL